MISVSFSTPTGSREESTTASAARIATALRVKFGDATRVIPDVLVGYTGEQAFRLHEDMEMRGRGLPRPSGLGNYWDSAVGPGQSKFLEQPARLNAANYAAIIVAKLKSGAMIQEALFAAGEELKADSQTLVPYEHGDLCASAFVRYDYNTGNSGL